MRIQKTEYKRLPHPFPSKCTNDKPHDIFPGKYTRHKCIESIAYSKLLEKCGGVYDYHKRYIPSEKLKKYARPNKLATDIHLCLQKESFKETNEENGKCLIPWEETEFQMTTTFNKRTRSEVKKDGGETVFRIAFSIIMSILIDLLKKSNFMGGTKFLVKLAVVLDLFWEHPSFHCLSYLRLRFC